MEPRFWALAGAVLGFLGVAAGAFGAHALSGRLEPRQLQLWSTGGLYQLVHALALVALAAWTASAPARAGAPAAQVAGWAFLAGTLVFSGTLYFLALSGPRWLGMITPLGGVLFLVGWASIAWLALRDGK